MKRPWIEQINLLNGTIQESIDYLKELQQKYPEPRYEIKYDSRDDEVWIVDAVIVQEIVKEESERFEKEKKEQIRLQEQKDIAEFERLSKKFKKE